MEAKRVLKPNGLLFISYFMNEYAVITQGFIENNKNEAINNKLLNKDFKITPKKDDLYSFARLEDIDKLNELYILKELKY